MFDQTRYLLLQKGKEVLSKEQAICPPESQAATVPRNLGSNQDSRAAWSGTLLRAKH